MKDVVTFIQKDDPAKIYEATLEEAIEELTRWGHQGLVDKIREMAKLTPFVRDYGHFYHAFAVSKTMSLALRLRVRRREQREFADYIISQGYPNPLYNIITENNYDSVRNEIVYRMRYKVPQYSNDVRQSLEGIILPDGREVQIEPSGDGTFFTNFLNTWLNDNN